MYELKEYLKAINQTKEPLMDGDDEEWERKYPPFIVNKLENLEYVKEFYGYSNAKAKAALDVLSEDQLATIKRRLYKGGKNGRD